MCFSFLLVMHFTAAGFIISSHQWINIIIAFTSSIVTQVQQQVQVGQKNAFYNQTGYCRLPCSHWFVVTHHQQCKRVMCCEVDRFAIRLQTIPSNRHIYRLKHIRAAWDQRNGRTYSTFCWPRCYWYDCIWTPGLLPNDHPEFWIQV